MDFTPATGSTLPHVGVVSTWSDGCHRSGLTRRPTILLTGGGGSLPRPVLCDLPRWRPLGSPGVGMHDAFGITANNVVIGDDHLSGLCHCESLHKDPFDPERPYKAIG